MLCIEGGVPTAATRSFVPSAQHGAESSAATMTNATKPIRRIAALPVVRTGIMPYRRFVATCRTLAMPVLLQ
jgi:hypothetical protein